MGKRLAFYAPLKSPSHPVPSGDRRMARLLIKALEGQGHQVEIASHLRSYDRAGDPLRQQRLQALGERVAATLIRRYQQRPKAARPEVWITYHGYHKSPDWLGPAVRRALGIPYVLIETSFAGKQANGPWRLGHEATERSLREADIVLALTAVDRAGLTPVVQAPSRLQQLSPFLDIEPFADGQARRHQCRDLLAKRYAMNADCPWLLTVAMMRDDVKRQSYKLLSRSLQEILDRPWQILLVGSGPAFSLVENYFSLLQPGRVHMAGILSESELVTCYAAADVYAWPAVREAYGLAFLEAQANGLPVVAGNEGGVSDVVQDGTTGLLTSPRDPKAFACALADLLDRPEKRQSMSRMAIEYVGQNHSLAGAAKRLDEALIQAGDVFYNRRL